MVIVESKKEFSKFGKDFNEYSSVVIPIQCDENKHPKATNLCLLYVKMLDGDLNEYILPFRHTDAINLNPEKYMDIMWSRQNKYTYDKKKLLHFFDWKNVYDVQINHYLKTNQPLETDDISTNAHEYFNRKYYNNPNVNCVIPIMKHLEWCRKMLDKIKLCAFTGTKETEFISNIYNSEVLESLQSIESNGLQTLDGMVYSEYNPYTATGRPSNRFGGMNFAALNKKDGSRKQFVSRFKNGVLVEMDFDAYHLRLIGDKINYALPSGSVHEHMAEFYGVDYEEAKSLSFQYLYGYIPEDVIQINPYFKKVSDYVKDLWKSYNSKEFIVSDIYKRQIHKKNLTDMNANKLFNYSIQLMETENNMRVLSTLIPAIKKYKSKLILYSYDSFLFDFNMEDGLNYLKKVKKILEQDGKYPVKVSWGINYHEMKNITEKFE